MFRQAEFNPARATKAPIMDDRAAARRCGEERTAPNWPTNDAVCCHSPHPKRCTKPMGLRAIGTLRVVGRANALRRIAEAAPVVERLRRTGLYVSDALVKHILQEDGE
jgi:hypothetical protein